MPLTQIRHVQNHGLEPRLFAQNRPISDSCKFTRNTPNKSRKYFQIDFQAFLRRLREFGAIFGTYPNPPCSKPWDIAQAFCSKSENFGPLRIHPKYPQTVSEVVINDFQAFLRRFREFGAIFGTYPNPPCSKPWAIAQAFCSKSANSGPLRIHPKYPQTVSEVVINDFQAFLRRLREFGAIFGTYPNPPCSKPWAIAQAFCSKSANSGPLRIHPKYPQTVSQVVINRFSSIFEAFQRVWSDFRHIPKSAMFETMGYSSGFLLKIGKFRTLADSPEIPPNSLASSYKSIFKHF